MRSSFKRILYTSLVDVSLPYGPGVNERGFLKDMVSRDNYDVCAVIPKPARGMPKELEGLKVHVVPAFVSVRSLVGWLQARAVGSLTLLRAIESFRPDLIVIRTAPIPLPHFFASRSSAVPYVLKTAGHGTFRGFYAAHGARRPLRHFSKPMLDQVMYSAACIDVVSPSQRDMLSRLYPSLAPRIHVIDNGVDLQHFGTATAPAAATRQRLGLDSQDIVVGYVGNVPMQRGGKEVIDAVASLRSMGRLKGLVVGDSGEAERCKQYAMERGVSDLIVTYGEADYAEVSDLMAVIDVGLSILRPNERSASEQKVRQYLASGLCVVGTAGSNDFLRGLDFARVVETTDPEEVVKAVAEFARRGRDRLATLGQQARAFAESTLSLAGRNDQRLKLWGDACKRQ